MSASVRSLGDRADVPNLAVLITHGTHALDLPEVRENSTGHAREEVARDDSPVADLAAARALRDSGVGVIAVGVTDEVDKRFLSKLSSPPQVQNVFRFMGKAEHSTEWSNIIDSK